MLKIIKILFAFFPLFAFFNNSFGQKVTIKGTIYDKSNQQPIEFANISVKNTATGTVADSLGRFSLKMNIENQAVVIVSHIAYHKQEIVIDDRMASDTLKIHLQPKATHLADVVISANLYEQSLDKLTKSADIISHRQISDNMNTAVADVLSPIQGMSQVWEYHSPLILRGLHSTRLVVLQDGNPRMGPLPGGYMGQDLNIYNAKRIEVIKGPASVIYGSGAISGIVNVVTGEPFGNKKFGAKVTSGYATNNNEFLEALKLCHKTEKFGISLSGKYLTTSDMKYAGDEIAENSAINSNDLALKIGYKFSDVHKIVLNSQYHYGKFEKPRGFNGPDKKFTEVDVTEEIFHADLAYIYSPKNFIELININLFYDDAFNDFRNAKHSLITDALTSADIVHYKYNYGGSRLFSVLNIDKSNKLTIGTDNYFYHQDDNTKIIDYYYHTEGSQPGKENAEQKNIGIFINDEWEISSHLRINSGIRYDVANVNEGSLNGIEGKTEKRTALSGNVGCVYSFNEHQHFSVNVARSFRMPTIKELYATVINSAGVRKGNPDLQPEYGYNFDVGFRGTALNHKLTYNIAGFYYMIEDFISMIKSEETGTDFTFANKQARIAGGESTFSYQLNSIFSSSDNLNLSAGASYVYGEDLSGTEAQPLHAIPPFDMNIGINYRQSLNKNFITGYSVKFEALHSAEQNRVPPTTEDFGGSSWGYIPSEPHTVFNFSLGLNSNALPGYPKLRLIVNNVFDTDYKTFGSYIPAMGRNFKILLSFNF